MSAQDVIFAPFTINKRAERKRRLLLFTVFSAASGAVVIAMLICLPYAQLLLHDWIS